VPNLANPKHERFATSLAKGVKQGDAYIDAGYAPNKGAASRLAQSPKIIDRVVEIKTDINKRINTALAHPDEPEHFESLKNMGITMDWIGGAYKKIYDRALETAQLGAANTAVVNLQKLVEIEQGGKNDEDDGEDRMKISDAVKLIEGMAAVAKATRDPGETFSDMPREIRDITPQDGPGEQPMTALPPMDALDAYLSDDLEDEETG